MNTIIEEAMEGYSRNTQLAYAGQWSRFVEWLEDNGQVTALPIAPDQIRKYLRFQSEQGKSAATLGQICKAIDAYHAGADLPKPSSIPSVKKTLRELRRQSRTTPSQAHPLTDENLQQIIRTATKPRPFGSGRVETKERALRRGLVDIALIRTMRDAQLRRGEAEMLKWSDIKRIPEGAGLLAISFSKTDPTGEGAVQYLSADTMKALAKIKKFRGTKDFIFGLCGAQIARRIKAVCAAAGLDGIYSGHSPRVGMTVDMVRKDISTAAVQQAGRWKSPSMVQHYTRNEQAQRGAVARYYENRRKAAKSNSGES